MQDKFNIVYSRLKHIKLDENVLCTEFWMKVQRLYDNFNEPDCWGLITDNIEWLFNAKSHFGLDIDIMTTAEIREWFSEKELNANNIFISGSVTVSNGFAIGLGDVKIEANGHSKIVLFDDAFADCYDTTFVSGFNTSSFVVTDCIGSAFDYCKAEAKGVSIIEDWSRSLVKCGRDCLVVER